MLYFDHNATTPLARAAREAWLRVSEDLPGNPSSPHRIGSRADAALEDARQRLANMLGCDAYDIVWTSGATEANNTVLAHLARTSSADAEVWVSALEHPCVMQATSYYFGKRWRLIPVEPSGALNLNWLTEELAHARPVLVSVMAANNETGVVQPWREALAMCKQWGVPFFSDAVQWLGKLDPEGLGACDFMSASAHKFGGPRGVGFLKCGGATLTPLLHGGPQQEGRRAGTENVAGVIAMVAALEERQQRMQAGQHLTRLPWRMNFETGLRKSFEGIEIVGAQSDRLWNTVSVVMPELKDCQRWVVKLDKAGYAVSTGSACSSGKEQPSHVLAAMGYKAATASRVIRVSSGWETTENDWRELLSGIRKVAAAAGLLR